MEKNKESIKIIRATDFSQEAYIERRKKYIENLDKFLSQKEEWENKDKERYVYSYFEKGIRYE